MKNCAETNRFADFVVPSIIVASLLVVLFGEAGIACGYDENATEEAEISLVREAVELDATDTIFSIENDLKCDCNVVKRDVFFSQHKFWEDDRSASDKDLYYGLHRMGGEEDIVTNLIYNLSNFFFKWLIESKALLISGAISFFLLQCLVFKKGTVAKNTASTITFALFVGGLLFGLTG